MDRSSKIAGILLGLAVGDSLGLPAEGLRRSRLEKVGWSESPWKQRLLFGKGMVSDDTEHTVLVAESILESGGSVERFDRIFSKRLRGWFLACPPGIGFATLRACLKLSFGISPKRSGVFSAGNGPAMRSGIIGALFSHDAEMRRAYVEASSRITHTDPMAESGSQAIAEIVSENCNGNPSSERILEILKRNQPLRCELWTEYCANFESCLEKESSVAKFAEVIGAGGGVSGFVLPSVFVSVYSSVLHQGDFAGGMEAILNCGGDADTTGAIYGALAGSFGGVGQIPTDWIQNLRDWPWSEGALRRLATELSTADLNEPNRFRISGPWVGRLVRNGFMTAVILAHVILRLLPGGFALRMLK